jgi:hypothetical protein
MQAKNNEAQVITKENNIRFFVEFTLHIWPKDIL